ncbi:MAG: glycerophosphodiester phosphodiesterase [Clostridiaceae bacterium]|nr:glycerophosphodiester phosphodiesterase [Clostridiaceae bacterium]
MHIFIAVLLLIFCLVLFLVKPGKRRTESLETKYFAHRGLHDDTVPENSMEAFRRAKNRGYGVELDVQLTKDQKLVVFHDNDLERMCGVKKKVDDLTYEELLQYPLKGGGDRIPLLEDVLGLLEDVPVILEVKTQRGEKDLRACPAVCEAIDRYKGKIYVESFSPFVIRWFKNNRPDIIRGQLSMDFIKNRTISIIGAIAMKNLLVNCLSGPDFIAYRNKDKSLGFWLVKTFFNPLIVLWTVTSPEEFHSLPKDVHGVIFEKFTIPADK